MKAIKIYYQLDNKTVGIFQERDGTFLALTFTKSKKFKTYRGAKTFIERYIKL